MKTLDIIVGGVAIVVGYEIYKTIKGVDKGLSSIGNIPSNIGAAITNANPLASLLPSTQAQADAQITSALNVATGGGALASTDAAAAFWATLATPTSMQSTSSIPATAIPADLSTSGTVTQSQIAAIEAGIANGTETFSVIS